ncbi:hypothetical protein BGP84_02500 [Pseudomonas putida]|jgi:hypothetical protein|uniref:Uncharacterized protein n=1 Tax=Pseudomonas putida TaxID=303 RepID=A0A2S3X9A4_PSEPU|nr:hypothetical protein [Pseudomonas putida]POG01510.1 hypothetical protein BGP85_23755 [Pseudomonas putida]POG12174.1 hypothetical protein BGP84_02500 [Pseudomonas putida]
MFRTDFSAQLYCTTEGYSGYVGVCDRGAAPWSTERDGWLVIRDRFKDNSKDARLLFLFEADYGTRVYYRIRGADDGQGGDLAEGKLGYSLNGYVGFYGISTANKILDHVSPLYAAFATQATVKHWKLEAITEWERYSRSLDGVQLHLRDDQGRRVAAYQDPLNGLEYLNVESGKILTFELHHIKIY